MLLTIALIEVRASQICSVSNLATLFKKKPTTHTAELEITSLGR